MRTYRRVHSCEPVKMAKEDPTEIFQEGLDPGRLLGPRGLPGEGRRIPLSARAVVSPGLARAPWRVLGIVILGVITWVFTKSWKATTTVTVLFHSIRAVIYYFHERLWGGIDWGLKNMYELTEKEKEKVMERLRKLGYLD